MENIPRVPPSSLSPGFRVIAPGSTSAGGGGFRLDEPEDGVSRHAREDRPVEGIRGHLEHLAGSVQFRRST